MSPDTLPLPPLSQMRAWLQPQPRERFLGHRLACASCPLVQWLKTCYPIAETITVDEVNIRLMFPDNKLVEVNTPDDYARLIWCIDYSGVESVDATVEECITALNEILTGEES